MKRDIGIGLVMLGVVIFTLLIIIIMVSILLFAPWPAKFIVIGVIALIVGTLLLANDIT